MNTKELGQIFTPPHLVDLILDEVGYSGPTIIDAKIMEPSFGTGNFLEKIIERLVTECKKQGLSSETIKHKIETNIHGIEIDDNLYRYAVDRLNKFTSGLEIPLPRWNLENVDALKFNKNERYDFCVGNPPYVRIQTLSSTTRDILSKYSFAGGNTDLYIAFFELGIKMLSHNGKLAYITPNSFINNISQSAFRKYLIKNNLLYKIIDFGTSRIFNDADTYSAITILSKSKTNNNIIYSRREVSGLLDLSIITPSRFPDEKSMGQPWHFCGQEDEHFLHEVFSRKTKLGHICTAQHGCATNKDSVYVGIAEPIDDKTMLFNGMPIENDILRYALKGGRPETTVNNRFILFPYEISDSLKYIPIKENVLKEKYPLAYTYLLSNEKELKARNMDASLPEWYRFGRSQGINAEYLKKIVVKNTIAPEQKTCEIVEADKGTIVYAGVFITAVNDKYFSVIKKILQSEDFCRYCKLVGKDMSGGYKAISAKHINDYGME